MPPPPIPILSSAHLGPDFQLHFYLPPPPHPGLLAKPKNQGRGVQRARKAGVGRPCPGPSQVPHLPTAIHTPHSGVLGWGSGTRDEGWDPQVPEGALYKLGGMGKPPCPHRLGAAERCCSGGMGGGLEGGADALEPPAGERQAKKGTSLSTCLAFYLHPSLSTATQDEGPALPARAGAPPPSPGLTAPAPRPRPAPRPPAGSPAPGCAEPPGG